MLEYQPEAARKLRGGRAVAAIAAAAEITQQQLRNIEGGATPQADTLGRLATALGVQLGAFYADRPRPKVDRRLHAPAQVAPA